MPSFDWGQPNTAPMTLSLSFEGVRAYGNISPDVADMTLDSFSLWAHNTLNNTRRLRIALYSGGTLSDVNGATLLASTGVFTFPALTASPTWYTLAPTVPGVAIPRNSLIWVVAAFEQVTIRYSTNSADSGNFQSARAGARVENQRPATDVMTLGFPSTLSTVTFGSSWLPLYMTYSTPAPGPSLGAIEQYRRNQLLMVDR